MGTAGFGHTVYAGLGEETTYGTPVTRTVFLDVTGETLSLNHERVVSGSLNQIGVRSNKIANGLFRVAGDVTFDVPYTGWELFLKHALGSVATTGPVDNAYTHTFDIANALPTGLTIEIYRDSSNFLAGDLDDAFLYEGCKVNSLSLSATIGAYLSCTASIVAQDENRGARTVAATVNTDLNATRDLIVFTEGSLSYDNFTTSVESFELTLNNNLNADRFRVGSRLTREPVRGGKIEVTGSFTADFDSFARYDEFKNSTTKALTLTFTGANVPNSGTAQSMTITLNRVIPTGVDLNVDDGGILTQTIPFVAYRAQTPATPHEVRVALVNNNVDIP